MDHAIEEVVFFNAGMRRQRQPFHELAEPEAHPIHNPQSGSVPTLVRVYSALLKHIHLDRLLVCPCGAYNRIFRQRIIE